MVLHGVLKTGNSPKIESAFLHPCLKLSQGLKLVRPSPLVEFHATMESCSDKFHSKRCVSTCSLCLPCAHGALSTVLSSDCSDRLASPS
jgi:hypothetical protein